MTKPEHTHFQSPYDAGYERIIAQKVKEYNITRASLLRVMIRNCVPDIDRFCKIAQDDVIAMTQIKEQNLLKANPVMQSRYALREDNASSDDRLARLEKMLERLLEQRSH